MGLCQKITFESEDALWVSTFDEIIDMAKADGKSEVSAYEAVPYNGSEDIVWCDLYESVERSECTKKSCSSYESKSGRGVCKNRGKFYQFGEMVTIKI